MRQLQKMAIVCMVITMCHSYAANLQKFIIDEDSCIKRIVGEKIYFHEKSIYPSTDGVYIQLDNDENFIIVPELSFDGQGYFINISHLPTNGDSFRPNFYWTCPKCGFSNSCFTNRCKNPECPSIGGE